MRVQSQRLLHIGAAVATALLLSACGDKTPPASSGSSAAASAPGKSADASEGGKLHTYVSCYNAANRHAVSALERYASWIPDRKAGPTGKEPNIHGVYTVPDSALKKCADAATAAQASPAMSTLDPLATAYAAALKTWAERLAEADLYYTRQDYKDDGMAKGKAMHPGLVAAWDAFKQASVNFDKALEVENDQRHQTRLAELEKSGKRDAEYWQLATMTRAKALVRVIGGDDFNVDDASAKLSDYEAQVQGLKAFTQATDPKQLPTMWSSLDSSAESYLVAAKKRVRRVRDKEPYSRGDHMQLSSGLGDTVSGSPMQVMKAYNALISKNNMQR